MHDMSKKPDLSGATKVGEPSLLDPKETDAAALARELTNSAMADLKASQVGKGKVAIETVAEKTKITENQAAPRSSDPALSPNDIPKKAPDQLNESTSDSSDEEAANSSSSSSTNDDSKDASSSRKEKKKHRKKIPVPF